MAQLANTFESYDAVGNREELADMIWNLDPDETPFMSLIGRKSVKSVHPEWQTDGLAAINLNNNYAEGAEFVIDASSATTRVGNYCQISQKTLSVTRTQEATDKAGRSSEMAYQVAKRSSELKRDMEAILLSNQASNAGTGNGATNRLTGGFRAWLASNDSLGSTGASGGFNTSTNLVDAATNGTQRAFDKSILDAVILSTYNNGGNPTTLMVSPYVKTVFSGLMDGSDVAAPRYMSKTGKDNTIIASASIYASDFGDITVVPNRQMAIAGATIARNAFLVDPKMVKVGIFDDIKIEKLAKTGDGEQRAMVCEYTLLVNNEKAHGVAADLFGLTASS